jgi:hypothetical protein
MAIEPFKTPSQSVKWAVKCQSQERAPPACARSKAIDSHHATGVGEA